MKQQSKSVTLVYGYLCQAKNKSFIHLTLFYCFQFWQIITVRNDHAYIAKSHWGLAVFHLPTSLRWVILFISISQLPCGLCWRVSARDLHNHPCALLERNKQVITDPNDELCVKKLFQTPNKYFFPSTLLGKVCTLNAFLRALWKWRTWTGGRDEREVGEASKATKDYRHVTPQCCLNNWNWVGGYSAN